MLIYGKCILIGYFSFLFIDSDSDNFQSLKEVSKSKQNGAAKPTKSNAERVRPGVKEGVKSPSSTGRPAVKSPVTPSSRPGRPAVKSPTVPVTPKSAPPPQPKQTPTSVLDYFGSATVQRSDKKLVASTKRKAVSTDELCPVFTSSLRTLSLFSCAASSSKPPGSRLSEYHPLNPLPNLVFLSISSQYQIRILFHNKLTKTHLLLSRLRTPMI